MAEKVKLIINKAVGMILNLKSDHLIISFGIIPNPIIFYSFMLIKMNASFVLDLIHNILLFITSWPAKAVQNRSIQLSG